MSQRARIESLRQHLNQLAEEFDCSIERGPGDAMAAPQATCTPYCPTAAA